MSRRLIYGCLVLIFVIALVVRLWGLSFGLPHPSCRPDEATIVEVACLIAAGDPNPHFFHYPSLMIYLLAAWFGLRDAILAAVGGGFVPACDIPILPPSDLLLAARYISTMAGAVTVLPVFVAARRLAGDGVALISALLLALCYPHVRESHFGTTDVLMTLFIALAAAEIVRYTDPESPSTHAHRAGFLAGLAASTKYAGAMLLVPFLWAHIERIRRSGNTFWFASANNRTVLAFIVTATAGFLFTTPFALLDIHAFLRDLGSEMGHLAEGHVSGDTRFDLGRGWWFHARYTLLLGLGLPWCLLAIAGAVWLILRKRPGGVALLLFPVIYYLYAGSGRTVLVRYMVPMLPYFCICAAIAIYAFASYVRRIPATAGIVLTLLVLIVPLRSTICFDRLLATTDSRLLATQWLAQHVPSGASVYMTGLTHGQPQCPPELRSWTRKTGGLSDFMVIPRHPLRFSWVPVWVEDMLYKDYRLIHTIQAFDPSVHGNMYDQLDAFYLPYAGLYGVERQGPNIEIYERIHR